MCEIVPSVLCPFRCPTCSYQYIKRQLGCWKRNVITPQTLTNTDTLTQIIHRLAEGGVSLLVWTGGGEPIFYRGWLEGMQIARNLGMENALYTNGSLLTQEKIEKMIALNPLFVRVSLNCGDEYTHAMFHGYNHKGAHFERVKRNIELLAQAREQAGEKVRTDIGVAVIFNEVNVEGLPDVARVLQDIAERTSGISFVLYRPVYGYYGRNQVEPEVLDRGRELLETEVPAILKNTGIRPIVLWPRFEALEEKGRDYTHCRASGFFAEVGPDGKMYLCCERNLDPLVEIGDLMTQTVEEIWQSERRKRVLEFTYRTDFAVCPPFCKPHRINILFEQIEAYRERGDIESVRSWIEAQQRLPIPPDIIYP